MDGDVVTWAARVEGTLDRRPFRLKDSQVGPIDGPDGVEIEAHQFLSYRGGIFARVTGGVGVALWQRSPNEVVLGVEAIVTGARWWVRDPAGRLLRLAESALLDAT